MPSWVVRSSHDSFFLILDQVATLYELDDYLGVADGLAEIVDHVDVDSGGVRCRQRQRSQIQQHGDK